MKIAFFLDVPEGLGGAGNLLLQQAGIMAKIHEVIVVIPRDEKGIINQEYARRCKTMGLSYEGLIYKTSFSFRDVDYLHAVLSSKNIKAFVVQKKIEFLHSVQINPAVEMVSRELGIPHLMNVYQMRDEEFVLAYVDIFAKYHLCDSVLYANKWSSHLKIQSKCVRPVAPLEYIIPKSQISKQYYRIVVVGNVCQRKNQLTAIKAVEMCLEKYDITLEIAGYIDCSYGEMCRAYVEQNHLQNKVHFNGFVREIASLLQESDFLLCASLDESFPMSMVEAVTYDLTIISTPVAGVPELFQNRYNAYISKGFEVKDIAEIIMDAINACENGSIDAVRQRARQLWEQQFSPETVCEQIGQYYSSILESRYIGDAGIYKQISIEKMQQLAKTIKLLDGAPDPVCDKVFYYTYLKETNICGKAYIWGAGKLGQQAYELIRLLALDIEIVAFVDKNKTGMYCGLPIIRPDEICYEEVDYFFISFGMGRDEVIDYLNKRGIAYNRWSYLLP
ncbi:MAG: glycosyltransferase [Lachnospiraceae bacterium]|nr:glycosyltransferase [Lachnospiraceae bacterium]